MAYKKYKTIDAVVTDFQLVLNIENWIKNLKCLKAPQLLQEQLDYTIKNYAYKTSEASICEMILFPILNSAMRSFNDTLMLWSHKTISYKKEWTGIPDYLISKHSPHGKTIFGAPLLLAVAEAKKDDFELGWAQCAIEMHVVQQLNNNPTIPILGIVSNGEIWQFGLMEKNKIIQEAKSYSLFQLDELYTVLMYLFEECKKTALKIDDKLK